MEWMDEHDNTYKGREIHIMVIPSTMATLTLSPCLLFPAPYSFPLGTCPPLTLRLNHTSTVPPLPGWKGLLTGSLLRFTLVYGVHGHQKEQFRIV